jgi:hypothetical protein
VSMSTRRQGRQRRGAFLLSRSRTETSSPVGDACRTAPWASTSAARELLARCAQLP